METHDFKIGDMVLTNSPYYKSLKKGTIGQILDINANQNPPNIHILVKLYNRNLQLVFYPKELVVINSDTARLLYGN